MFSGEKGNIYLYDIRNTSKARQSFGSESKEILSVSWHPIKPNLFCSGGMDNFIRVWDINTDTSSLADFKTSDGVSKVKFLKSNPNYIISTYQTNNYNINLWNFNIYGLSFIMDSLFIISFKDFNFLYNIYRLNI